MHAFAPDLLASWTGGRWTKTPSEALTEFTVDTRLLRPGQVFVALKTIRRDGHAFLGAAQLKGASAAIVTFPNPALVLPQLVVGDPLAALQAIARAHRRRFTGAVIGITGSAGKTSTKELLTLLLGGADGGVLATEGNLNNHIGVPLTLLRLDPEVHRHAVVEAGISAPGEMGMLAGLIEPDLALVTLVAPAHLAELGGIEGVAKEKAVLPAAVRPAGVAVFPSACLEFGPFRDLGVRKLVVEAADVLRPAEPPKDRVYFTTTHRGGTTAVALAYGKPPPLVFTFRRVSDGMAQNAALAICTALWLGVRADAIQARLEAWSAAPLRGEWRLDGARRLYLDCYNANPAAMADAIEAFCAVAPPGEPRLFILGCMEDLGLEAPRYHRELGRFLHLREGDRLMIIGSEAEAVREGALEHGNRPDRIEIADSLAPIAARLAEFQGAVFVKGSRRYQLERALSGAAIAETVHA